METHGPQAVTYMLASPASIIGCLEHGTYVFDDSQCFPDFTQYGFSILALASPVLQSSP